MLKFSSSSQHIPVIGCLALHFIQCMISVYSSWKIVNHFLSKLHWNISLLNKTFCMKIIFYNRYKIQVFLFKHFFYLKEIESIIKGHNSYISLLILRDLMTIDNLYSVFPFFCGYSLIVWLILFLCPAGHSSGGPHDYWDVFWRQYTILRQWQCSPADFNPGYQRQHSGPPKAALLPATKPPGPGRLGATPWPRPEHCPGAAGTVKQPTLWTIIYPCMFYIITVSKEVLMCNPI